VFLQVRCLYAASEVAGFAKTGGLADVAAALPQALARRGHACAILMPLYRAVRQGPRPLESTGLTFSVPIGGRPIVGSLWRSALPGSPVPVYLVEQPELFERDDPEQGRGLYQFTAADGRSRDYPDNLARFAFFSRAVCEAARLLDLRPEVLHLNEWQTGLAAAYQREFYRRPDTDGPRTLFTIHNLAYQGLFPAESYPTTGLPWRLFTFEGLEFYGHLNCLKAGIVYAELVNTVSPTYAREIQTPIYGQGLHGLLAARGRMLSGILNGVDYRVWDPSADPQLPAGYDSASLVEGKAACRRVLLQECGLPQRPGMSLLGMVGRLVEQKGIDLLIEALPALFNRDVQLVMLGEGDPGYHKMLQEMRSNYPERLAVLRTQDERLAHLLCGAADLFLMPSLFEPCGLVQLYAMRFGAVPVVRATGGLADTVTNATEEALAAGTATGFTFGPPAARFFLEAIDRALALFRELPADWLRLARLCMQHDWSWDHSAAEYEKLYERVGSGK
jgi:starch synthase